MHTRNIHITQGLVDIIVDSPDTLDAAVSAVRAATEQALVTDPTSEVASVYVDVPANGTTTRGELARAIEAVGSEFERVDYIVRTDQRPAMGNTLDMDAAGTPADLACLRRACTRVISALLRSTDLAEHERADVCTGPIMALAQCTSLDTLDTVAGHLTAFPLTLGKHPVAEAARDFTGRDSPLAQRDTPRTPLTRANLAVRALALAESLAPTCALSEADEQTLDSAFAGVAFPTAAQVPHTADGLVTVVRDMVTPVVRMFERAADSTLESMDTRILHSMPADPRQVITNIAMALETMLEDSPEAPDNIRHAVCLLTPSLETVAVAASVLDIDGNAADDGLPAPRVVAAAALTQALRTISMAAGRLEAGPYPDFKPRELPWWPTITQRSAKPPVAAGPSKDSPLHRLFQGDVDDDSLATLDAYRSALHDHAPETSDIEEAKIDAWLLLLAKSAGVTDVQEWLTASRLGALADNASARAAIERLKPARRIERPTADGEGVEQVGLLSFAGMSARDVQDAGIGIHAAFLAVALEDGNISDSEIQAYLRLRQQSYNPLLLTLLAYHSQKHDNEFEVARSHMRASFGLAALGKLFQEHPHGVFAQRCLYEMIDTISLEEGEPTEGMLKRRHDLDVALQGATARIYLWGGRLALGAVVLVVLVALATGAWMVFG